MSWVPAIRKPLAGSIFFFHTLTMEYIYNKKGGTSLRPAMDMVGPYCHPLHVQCSTDSSCLLIMLTTREGGAAAAAAKRVEDDGEASDVSVNYLGDDGAAML